MPTLIIALIATLIAGVPLPNVSGTHQSASVEVGLAEVSPRGDAGGYAVPASGGSSAISGQRCIDENTLEITLVGAKWGKCTSYGAGCEGNVVSFVVGNKQTGSTFFGPIYGTSYTPRVSGGNLIYTVPDYQPGGEDFFKFRWITGWEGASESGTYYKTYKTRWATLKDCSNYNPTLSCRDDGRVDVTYKPPGDFSTVTSSLSPVYTKAWNATMPRSQKYVTVEGKVMNKTKTVVVNDASSKPTINYRIQRHFCSGKSPDSGYPQSFACSVNAVEKRTLKNISCLQPPPPKPDEYIELEWAVNTGGTSYWNTLDLPVTSDTPVHLQWNGTTGLTECAFTSGLDVPSGFVEKDGISMGDEDGFDRRLSLAAAGENTFRIRCRAVDPSNGNSNGYVTAQVSPYLDLTQPKVDLWIKDASKSDDTYTKGSVKISSVDQAQLKWESTNTNRCEAYNGGWSIPAGTNASTRNGSGRGVNEPSPSPAQRTYEIVCTDNNGVPAYDSVTLYVEDGPPELIITNTIIRKGEDADISWDLNANTGCDLTGPGVSETGITSEYIVTSSPSNTATYTLTCPNGTDTETIYVLPAIQET